MNPGKQASRSTRAGNGGPNTSSRLSSRKTTNGQGAVTWGDVDANSLQACIDKATSQGALVSFSKTGDGGALHLRVIDGPDVAKEYAASGEAMDAYLEEFALLYS